MRNKEELQTREGFGEDIMYYKHSPTPNLGLRGSPQRHSMSQLEKADGSAHQQE